MEEITPPSEFQEEEKYILFVTEDTIVGTGYLFPLSKMTDEIRTTLTLCCSQGYPWPFTTHDRDDTFIKYKDCIKLNNKYGRGYDISKYKVVEVVQVFKY